MSEQKSKENVFAKKNRNKNIAIAVGAMSVAVGAVVYAVGSNNNKNIIKSIAPPAKVTKNDVDIRNSKEGFEKDHLGLTQSNTQVKELEQENYERIVKEKIINNETDIVERRDHNRRIEYTPHDDGLDVIDVKVVQQEIEVPSISLTPLAAPEIVAADHHTQNNHSFDYDEPPQYTQPNTAMPTTELATAIGNYASTSNTQQVQVSGPTDFTGMENFRQSLTATPQPNTTLPSSQEAETGGQLVAYKTSSTVIPKNEQQSSMYPLIKMGQIESAYTTLAANNKNMGPIQAVLTSGEYAGATLIGTVSTGNEALNFNFTEMYLPSSEKRISINAIALKADTLEVGTYTNIDKKWGSRIGKSILRGAVEFGSYYANEGTTTTTSSSTVTTSQKSRAAAEKVALGGIADEIRSDVEAIDTSIEITQERYSPIKVMFMSEVRITADTETSTGTLERNKQNTNYVESRVDEQSRPTRDIVPTNSNYNPYGPQHPNGYNYHNGYNYNNGYNSSYNYETNYAQPAQLPPVPSTVEQATE